MAYTLATFLRLPFFNSGKSALVTRWALVTLVVKVDSRSVLRPKISWKPWENDFGSNYEHGLNAVGAIVHDAGIVDQDIQTLAS